MNPFMFMLAVCCHLAAFGRFIIVVTTTMRVRNAEIGIADSSFNAMAVVIDSGGNGF